MESIARSSSRPRAAFAAYEKQLRPSVADNQAKGRQTAAMLGGAT
ncbi:hypothetical protein AB0F15_16685 [Amycolatopsis sp. NPDC026612]